MTYVNEGFKAVEQGLREANGMSEEDMVKEGLVTMVCCCCLAKNTA